MNGEQGRCALCGGKQGQGVTTFAAELGNGVVVVRHVPAMICEQCGEEWILDSVAEKLERIIEEARERKLQVEVADLQ